MKTTTDYPAYTVVIRTLGKAGAKYLTTLRSAKEQDLPPAKILVYIPTVTPCRPRPSAWRSTCAARKGW